MKTKILLSLLSLFYFTILLGCSGGSNKASLTSPPSSPESKNTENTLYFKGLEGMQQRLGFPDATITSSANDISKAKTSSILLSDAFSDATFTDGWLGPEVVGNLTVSQQNGVLNISGDATGSTFCDPVACEGRAGIISRAAADANAPIVASVDVNVTGSSTASSSVTLAVLALLDQSNFFTLSLAVNPDPFCNGVCLVYGAGGAPIPLAQNTAASGRLTISYQNGIYTVSFGSTTFPPISGPVLSGGVSVGLLGVARYNLGFGVNPADVILNATFDNASFDGTVFTPCDTSQSQQRLQDVLSAVQNLIAEMEANNVKFGVLPQAGAVLPRLNSALQLLQSGSYRNALNQLNGTLGPLREIQFGLQGRRGSSIPSSLVDEWVNDIGAIMGEINLVIQEVQVCA